MSTADIDSQDGCTVRLQEFEELERLAGIGSWRWDLPSLAAAGTDVMHWSRELCRMLGRRNQRLIGGADELVIYFAPDSWTRLRDAIDRARRTGEPWELELDAIREDDTGVRVISRGEAERDATGRIVRLRGTVQDITARRELTREPVELRARGEGAPPSTFDFLTYASHAMRTPMADIVGMATLLQEKEAGPAREGLETIRASSETLLGILNDVLDYAKLESGELVMERVPFVLEGMVEDVIDAMSDAAAHKGLELQFFVSGELPPFVVGDTLRLRQILLNLLSNAVRSTVRGGVTVLAEPYGEESEERVTVRFAVSDTGPGLSDEQIQNMFRGFIGADDRAPRPGSGAGLGLRISRRLVEMMGGSAGVQSLPGEGSTFWFTVPLRLSPIPLPTPLSYEALRGKRVLVVGNQPMSLLLIRQQLESLGLAMVTARNEAEAAAALERGVPFCSVLIDVDMAGSDSENLARRLRTRASLDVLPVIFAGSVRDHAMMTSAAGMGSAEYLVKPVRKGSLARTLGRLVRGENLDASNDGALRPLTGVSVLLAEDNLTNQRVSLMMLSRLGCDAEAVENGEAAVEAVRRKPYDLILLDCQMPVLDGWGAARAIRQLEASCGRRTPILALTANALPGDRERCLDAGMDEYLTKPLSLPQLHAELARWTQSAAPAS
jgi:signal transduction histidine kinase/DNA-binding response OmpR family regulator